MQRTSVRWGLGMGAVGAVIGVVSLLLGVAIGPRQQSAVDATQLVVVLFIGAMVRLLFLVVVVGLAYYTGFRIERAREVTQPGQDSQNRMDAVLAGGLVLFCDWLVQTLFIYVTGMTGERGPFLPYLGSTLIFGVICVLFGAGAAGIGARDAASRRVLARLAPASAATVSAATVEASPSESSSESSAESMPPHDTAAPAE